jgi:transposase InsO family protein
LTITDHNCSKASILIPCKESITTEGTAELYARYMVPYYGIPTKVISNRDPCFRAEFTKEICRILGIKQNISSANHPQTNGQSERTNQSMEQYLRTVTGKDQRDWARWIPLAQYVRNSWVNSTTKKTPYESILGYMP